MGNDLKVTTGEGGAGEAEEEWIPLLYIYMYI